MDNTGTIHLLMIEDDNRLGALLKEYLEKNQIIIDWIQDGLEGLKVAMNHHFDVVLLDLMLPTIDGTKICQRLREHSDVPIIMVTARGEEADRVMGLEIGADDYVSKPFSPRELLARVHAVLRRSRGQSGPKRTRHELGDLSLDPGTRAAILNGETIDLTSYEFDLLYALVERAGRVLSREQLMELARGNADESFDRSIDVHISRLRHKLGDDPRQPQRIKTVRGIGYQYMHGDA